VVLDDGFCWQGTHYRSLSRCANDHRHGVVGAAVLRTETEPVAEPLLAASLGGSARLLLPSGLREYLRTALGSIAKAANGD